MKYIFLSERQVFIYGKESNTYSGHYDLYINDYGKAEVEKTFENYSSTKLYFDFK